MYLSVSINNTTKVFFENMGALDLINSPKKLFDLLVRPSELAAAVSLYRQVKRQEKERDQVLSCSTN